MSPGFTAADLTVTGSATGATTALHRHGPEGLQRLGPGDLDGTVTLDLQADSATDAAGNGNEASTFTDKTVTVDTANPDVTVEQGGSQNDPTNTSPVVFDVDFDEDVTGLTGDDVITAGSTATMGGSTIGNAGDSDDSTYTISIPVTGDGR